MLNQIEHLGVSWIGRPAEEGPLPAFFYFALSGDESLTQEPYCQPIQFLSDYPIRCFSLTLPFHGEDLNPNQAIIKWANAYAQGDDPLTPFIEQCRHAVDELLKLNLIDPNHLYVGGLSRGGYAALHLAAKDPRFKAVLGYAPLTSFTALEEFQSKMETENLIHSLIHCSVKFYIGNRDERVGTGRAYQFIHALTEAKHYAGERSPKAEIVITPSIGHKGHGTSHASFIEGAKWILKQAGLL